MFPKDEFKFLSYFCCMLMCVFYIDDVGSTFLDRDVHIMEHQLSKDFSNLYEWFIENKSNIHLGECRTKCILFKSKQNLKTTGSLSTVYNVQRN